ncbi:type II secretion system F family protein [Nocardiopsis suaedae]|uniref:Type II secretion system F family protein n=1 Tax=Nocardiopsis suaedae TaxID=3018444 RepID=A0ABT4TRH5_9ACTN|nr:type II secretion system F family protein [Nocardiopsis suaedae]MDA2807269.1 type II secretion system F family protein [Nocardiopsis suaedae]
MTLTYPLIILLGLTAMGCVALAAWGYHLYTKKSELAEEDFIPPAPKKKANETFILHRVTERIGAIFHKSLSENLSDKAKVGIRNRLESAGHPDDLNVERYIQRKIGEAILYTSVAAYFFATGSVFISLVSVALIGMTDLQIYQATQKRQDDVQTQLPDFLDVLTVTVGAGLSFRQALSRVCDAMPGVLADEFRLTLRQMDMGTSRREAFIQLRRRNRNEALGKFVTALQQAEELGAPLGDALQTISLDMRREDAQYLRQKAMKLNPKVTGVTAATMLPGLILLVGAGLVLGSDVSIGSLGG